MAGVWDTFFIREFFQLYLLSIRKRNCYGQSVTCCSLMYAVTAIYSLISWSGSLSSFLKVENKKVGSHFSLVIDTKNYYCAQVYMHMQVRLRSVIPVTFCFFPSCQLLRPDWLELTQTFYHLSTLHQISPIHWEVHVYTCT